MSQAREIVAGQAGYRADDNSAETVVATTEQVIVVTTARTEADTRSSSMVNNAPAKGRWNDAAMPAPAADATRRRRVRRSTSHSRENAEAMRAPI